MKIIKSRTNIRKSNMLIKGVAAFVMLIVLTSSNSANLDYFDCFISDSVELVEESEKNEKKLEKEIGEFDDFIDHFLNPKGLFAHELSDENKYFKHNSLHHFDIVTPPPEQV